MPAVLPTTTEKSMEFEAVKVKSLEEIHQEKLSKSSTVKEGAPPTTISTSFNLKSVIAETLNPLKYPPVATTAPRDDSRFHWPHSVPTVPVTPHLPEAQRSPSIFPGAQHGGMGASIFGAQYWPGQTVSVAAPTPPPASVPPPSVSVNASTNHQPPKVSMATEFAATLCGPSLNEPSESPRTAVTSGVRDSTPSVRSVKQLSSHGVQLQCTYMYIVYVHVHVYLYIQCTKL